MDDEGIFFAGLGLWSDRSLAIRSAGEEATKTFCANGKAGRGL